MGTSSCMSPFWGPKGAAKFDELSQVKKKIRACVQTSVAHSLSLLEGCMNCCWHYGPKSVIKLSTVAVLSVELLVNCSAESLFLKSLSTHQIAALILQKESFCSHTSYSHTSYSGYFSTMEEKKSLLSLLWCEMGIHFAKNISVSHQSLSWNLVYRAFEMNLSRLHGEYKQKQRERKVDSSCSLSARLKRELFFAKRLMQWSENDCIWEQSVRH